MMTLRRHALRGRGRVAATRRPARRTAVRAGWAVRGRRGCAEVVWGAWGGATAARHRPLGSGSCEAVVAGLATTWGRPWRCGGAARVGGPRGVRAGRQAAAGLSWAGCLVPFGAAFDPHSLSV